MKYITPITDRTVADLVNRTDKAFFNVTDWERIYGNAEYVNNLLRLLLSINITFDTITAPTMIAIPTVADFNTLLTNINRIRIGAGFEGVPDLVELQTAWTAGATAIAFTYVDVNQWEQMLFVLCGLVSALADYIVFCGVANVGQPRFYQHRFRVFPFVQDAASPVRRARTNAAICSAGLTRNNRFRRYT